MIEAKNKASFTFSNYKVKEFSLIDPVDEEIEITLFFKPSGKYFRNTTVFRLFFDFAVLYGDDNKHEFIKAKIESDFQFEKGTRHDDIPGYFYANCIAIVFPHLRAFISTITSVANLKTLSLPIMNLTFLENELKENTEIQ